MGLGSAGVLLSLTLIVGAWVFSHRVIRASSDVFDQVAVACSEVEGGAGGVTAFIRDGRQAVGDVARGVADWLDLSEQDLVEIDVRPCRSSSSP